jgi:hypothetical protein
MAREKAGKGSKPGQAAKDSQAESSNGEAQRFRIANLSQGFARQRAFGLSVGIFLKGPQMTRIHVKKRGGAVPLERIAQEGESPSDDELLSAQLSLFGDG